MISTEDFLSLSVSARTKLLSQLQNAHKRSYANHHTRTKPKINCPFCNSPDFSLNGYSPSGKERFLCKSCNHSFAITTGTPIHAIKKPEKFLKYFNIMSCGYKPLKNMAEETGISLSAAFEWRHKILCAMESMNENYVGITDFRQSEMPFSRKGLKNTEEINENKQFITNVLAVADYRNHNEITVLSVGKLKMADFPDEIQHKLFTQAIVLAPWHKVVSDFFRAGKSSYTLFRPEKPYNRFDVRNADKLHDAMNTYIKQRMKGVSTKYLQTYSAWVERIAGFNKRNTNDWAVLIKNQMAWGRYANQEDSFRYFIENKADIVYKRSFNRNWKTAENFRITSLNRHKQNQDLH
ncbi:hypothetical protein SDC9_51928 [bioreactor metagenome]|uniref:InsA N-terminal zinc ribbon domain-containing protein n=1 Tax=bioreactor metagenome TaxID=1076179 RepID=A0A644WQ90_9ZZZZ